MEKERQIENHRLDRYNYRHLEKKKNWGHDKIIRKKMRAKIHF